MNDHAEKVLLPKELTAENGAKAALMGEFKFDVPVFCWCGMDTDCDLCKGSGEYMQPVNVPWIVIKKIYKAAVEHFIKGH